MTQEDKSLLLQDLCARLPYGVKIMFSHNGFRWDWEQTLDEITKCDDGEYAVNGWGIHGIKPYLRPMSSMSEKEKEEYYTIIIRSQGCSFENGESATTTVNDWLLSKHFDVRGLISKGLAIAVTKENNPYGNS